MSTPIRPSEVTELPCTVVFPGPGFLGVLMGICNKIGLRVKTSKVVEVPEIPGESLGYKRVELKDKDNTVVAIASVIRTTPSGDKKEQWSAGISRP